MTPSIGQQLRQAREERQLSLEQVAQATHIRVRYLEALEAGNFEALPSQAHGRGFLRAYASYLNLDFSQLLANAEGVGQERIPEKPEPASSLPPDSPRLTEPEQIFAEIGHRLRHQRELLGLSLEEVVRHTHLRLLFLQALEAGDLQGLPSPVQGRGMLNNYARFLGMDAERLLLLFAEGLQARLALRRQTSPETPPVPGKARSPQMSVTPARRRVSTDFLIGISLIIALAVFIVWGAIRIFNLRAEQPLAEPTAPSIVDVLLATPTETSLPTTEAATPSLAVSLPVEASSVISATLTIQPSLALAVPQGVQVYITIQQRAWMRVAVDGEVKFDGRVLPGNAYTFSGKDQVEVLTGNGAGLQVFYNQLDLGLMGDYGQIIHRIYTRSGVITPTPSVPPTVTPMPPTTPIPTSTSPAGVIPAP